MCAGPCKSLIVISCQVDIATRKADLSQTVWCWVIAWTSVFKVCWRQWLLWAWDQVLHDAACQELPWLPAAHLLIPCLAPGSVPEGFAEFYWAVTQWLPIHPAAADSPTEVWLALPCMFKQVKILHPLPKALPDVFTNMTGRWDGLGLECLTGIWGTCAQFPVLHQTLSSAPNYISAVVQ